jgi:hypothetical protein
MKTEIITIAISAPAGTRARLKSIRKALKITDADIFKYGIQYVFKRLEHAQKKAEQNRQSPPELAALPQPEPSRIILPD